MGNLFHTMKPQYYHLNTRYKNIDSSLQPKEAIDSCVYKSRFTKGHNANQPWLPRVQLLGKENLRKTLVSHHLYLLCVNNSNSIDIDKRCASCCLNLKESNLKAC